MDAQVAVTGADRQEGQDLGIVCQDGPGQGQKLFGQNHHYG
jgi:hypothetical protein